MPSKPKRRCRKPGCPELIEGGGYCPAHLAAERKRYDETQRASHKDIYNSKRWKKGTRPQIIARDSICKACNNALSACVDHIIPIDQLPHGKHDPDVFNPDNLQGLCLRCHAIKTARENKAAGLW